MIMQCLGCFFVCRVGVCFIFVICYTQKNHMNIPPKSIDEFLFKTWCLHYPQCKLATERQNWRQFIRLHAVSSGVTKGFILQ